MAVIIRSTGHQRHSSSPLLLATACLLLLQLASQTCQAAKTLADNMEPDNALACVCSDVDPRTNFFNANVTFNCEAQATFVNGDGTRVCDSSFMRTTPAELPEGYCQISCGRCPCCQPLAAVLASKGYSQMAQLFNLTDYGAKMAQPSFMATVLAVNDQGVREALRKLGDFGSVDEARQIAPDKAKSLALMHILPPLPDTLAVWSAPFFVSGAMVPTALTTTQSSNGTSGAKPAMLSAKRNPDGSTTLVGPKNGAVLKSADVEFCKGYIQVMDQALLPP